MQKILLLIEKHPQRSILIFAAIIRLLIAFLYGHVTIYPDSVGYIELAERLYSFDLTGYNGERTPGYPLLLCITGIMPVVTALAQLGLGVISVLLIYKILLLQISKKDSLYMTLILCLYIPSVFFELAILTEALTTVCIITLFYLFIKIVSGKENRIASYIVLALLCLYIVVIKPFYIFLPFLLSVFLLLQNFSFDTIKRSLLMILLPVLFFLGWSYMNKINTGYFVSTTFYGVNIAQTCVNFAEKTPEEYKQIGEIYAKYRDTDSLNDKELAMTIWAAYPELEEKLGLSGAELSDLLYKYGVATIKENPGSYLRQVIISWKDFWKTTLYWEPDENTIGKDVLYYVCQSERIAFQIFKLLFVILIPYHIVVYFLRRKLTLQLVLSIIVLCASILQAMVIYGNNSRFSFPFGYLIFVSVLISILDMKKRRALK